ncbi:MAG TPA: DUF167 family protein [Xanthobacteraceae bacterium]|nr:DUF167 family protein [Xanthobacteraceae bacterium]
MPRPWRVIQGAVLVDLRVTPKSSRDEIEAVEQLSDGQPVLKVRVRALPTEGEANDAVVALLAKKLRLPKSCVALERGGASRMKTLRLSGDPQVIVTALETITKGKA